MNLNIFVTNFILVYILSAELKDRLSKVAEKLCDQETVKIETTIPRMKELLLKVKQDGTFDLPLSVEGTKQTSSDEKLFELLEKADLVTGENKFTHRNNYRQYKLTSAGAEIAGKLAAEK